MEIDPILARDGTTVLPLATKEELEKFARKDTEVRVSLSRDSGNEQRMIPDPELCFINECKRGIGTGAI